MKTRDRLNTIIAIIIGLAVVVAFFYGIIDKDAIPAQALAISPWYMKALGLLCTGIGAIFVYLLAKQKIGSGNWKIDVVLLLFAIVFSTVFAWLIAVNFYNGSY